MSPVAESREIVSALRGGLVPRRGLSHFATGLEKLAKAVSEELDFVATGKGASKWIRGEYGSGKTFAARYLCAEARAKGFATSEVQISINDTPLHQLETVYRRLVERLETDADGPNAFQAIVDGWLYQLGEEVRRVKGLSEDDPAFADATEERLADKLADLSRRNRAFAAALRGTTGRSTRATSRPRRAPRVARRAAAHRPVGPDRYGRVRQDRRPGRPRFSLRRPPAAPAVGVPRPGRRAR